MRYFNSIFYIIAILLFFSGCASEKSNIASNSYHNTTARYNAYFIAKEKLREVEASIELNHQNNFNEVLHVFSDVDSTVISSMNESLEDVIRKASLAIQRHPSSKWVDDSYNVIGIARYYQGDFVNAIETFKYVNTKSESNDARHRALVMLMRTFLDYNEENNAIAVSDYLKKEKLNAENFKDLILTRAYMYQQREDYDNVVKQLIQIAPKLNQADNHDRIYFIIAQIYQMKGFDAEAFNYYNLCLKSNPKYELSFYAKLNMGQVTQLAEVDDVKKVRKYFKKLLRDRKNIEFRDKIYFEMAKFEIKQEDYDKAVELYKQSVSSSIRNQRQKGYSYLGLGKLYYDHYRNYELAKAYYDSTVAVLPDDDKLYSSVAGRQKILANFVEQISTIHLQDSLLALSEMDTTSLYAYLDEVIAERKRKEEEERERQQKRQSIVSVSQTNVYDPFGQNTMMPTSSGAIWYFYNSNAVSMGSSEFKRKWGDRVLEDNWRRSNKTSTTESMVQEITEEKEALADSLVASDDNVASDGNEREQLLSTIPFSEEEKMEALAKIEVAYYNLGKIYNFDLKEQENSVTAFETLLDRFPSTEFEPETLYLLYLIYRDLGNERFSIIEEKLIAKYPNSTFSKLIGNPNYKEESNLESEKLQEYYKKAYMYYLMDSVQIAQGLITEGVSMYPDNSFSDNMMLLQILVYAKADGYYKYQYELQHFEEKYPESELIDYVNQLLVSSENYQDDLKKSREIQYIPYFEQEHLFVLFYPSTSELADQLPAIIEDFNQSNFSNSDLRTGNLVFNDEFSIIVINEFTDRTEALTYFNIFNGEDSPLKTFSTYKFYNFAVSKDNFQILYQTKGLNEYQSFFKKNYL